MLKLFLGFKVRIGLGYGLMLGEVICMRVLTNIDAQICVCFWKFDTVAAVAFTQCSSVS